MRDITHIVIHCSATPEGRWHDVEDLRDWHVNGNGWSDVGYHFVVTLDGEIQLGRPVHRPGAHVKGHNATSIGICYVGGCDEYMQPKDTLTEEQELALEELVCRLRDRYGDELILCGHRDFERVNKECPSFDVSERFAHLM